MSLVFYNYRLLVFIYLVIHSKYIFSIHYVPGVSMKWTKKPALWSFHYSEEVGGRGAGDKQISKTYTMPCMCKICGKDYDEKKSSKDWV